MRIGKVAIAHSLMEDLGDVIGNKPKMIRKIGGLHFGNCPARQVGVPAVMKGHVVPDGVRQGRKKMGYAGNGFNVAVNVAVKDDARIGLDRALVIAPRKGPLLHIALVHLLVIFLFEVGTGHFVKSNQIIPNDKTGFVLPVLPS